MAGNDSAGSDTCPNSETPRIECDSGGVAFAGVFIVLILTTVLTNVAVIVVILRDRRLREASNYLYIFSLALADLSVGALGISSCYMYYLRCTDPVACSGWRAADLATGGVSMSNILVISIDRYHAFTSPLRHNTRRKSKQRKVAILVVAWVVPILAWTLPLFIPHALYDSQNVGSNMPVVVMFSVVLHVLPSVLIVGLYVRVLTIIQKLTISTARNARCPSDSSKLGVDVTRPKRKRSQSEVLQSRYGIVSSPPAVGMYGRRPTMSRSSPVTRPRAATSPATLKTLEWPWAKRPNKRDPDIFTITDGKVMQHVTPPPQIRTSQQTSYKKRRSAHHANFIVRYGDGESESDALSRPEVVVDRPKLYAHERVLSNIRNQRRYEALMARHRRATRLLFGIIVFFAVCWVPHSVVLLLLPLQMAPVGLQEAFKVTKALSFLNSTLNPLLYAFGNYDYRRALTELLCRKKRNVSLAMYRPSRSNVQLGPGPMNRITSR